MSSILTNTDSPVSFAENTFETSQKKKLGLNLEINAPRLNSLDSLNLQGNESRRISPLVVILPNLTTFSESEGTESQTESSPESLVTTTDSDGEERTSPEVSPRAASGVTRSRVLGLKLFSTVVSKTQSRSRKPRSRQREIREALSLSSTTYHSEVQRDKYEPLIDLSLEKIKGLFIETDIEVIKESDLGKIVLELGYEIIEQIISNGANSYLLKLTKDKKNYLLKLAKVGRNDQSISEILFVNGIIKDYIYNINRAESSILKITDNRIVKPEVLLTYGEDGYETRPKEGSIHVGQIYPFVEGVDLIEYAKSYKTGLPLSDIIHISYQLLETMAGLSRRKIFHRDIKPDNILIQPNGRLALIDFGQAKKVEDPISRIESPLSKTAYRYPLKDKVLNHQQDEAWSTGATIYQMTTGMPPKTSAPKVSSLAFESTRFEDLQMEIEAESAWARMDNGDEQVKIGIDLPEGLPNAFSEILRGLLSADQMTLSEAFEKIAPLENLRIRLLNSVIKGEADEVILAKLSVGDQENALKLLPSVKNQIKISLFDKHLSALPSTSLIHFSNSEKLKFVQESIKSQIREGILSLKTDEEILASLSEVEGIIATPLLSSLKDAIRASIVKSLPESFPSGSLIHFSLIELIKFVKKEEINISSD